MFGKRKARPGTSIPHTEAERELVLEGKEAVADGVVRLTLRDPTGMPLPEWEPGAHIDLMLKPDLVRQYSLCGDPADRSCLQIAVLNEPKSRGGSRYVHEVLAAGDPVRIRGPRNNFPLEKSKRYLFIAGGIGITPIIPMMAAAHSRGADWSLVYGGRTRDSMAFRRELQDKYKSRLKFRPQEEFGLLDLPTLIGKTRRKTAIYACGPEPLLAAIETATQDLPRGTLHVERFAARNDLAAKPRTSFDVELARSGTTLQVPENMSILHTVADAGVPVMTSCEEGICGTCQTKVLAGEVDHRDSVLNDRERTAGESMMICVSRAKGDHLVLDL